MKKNIGVYNAIAPTPVTLVGAMVGGKPSWFEMVWVGIAESDYVAVSIEDSHYTTPGITENRIFSISLVDEALLPKVDYAGIVSGKKVDKSNLFEWERGEKGAPIPADAPVTMEVEVADTLQYGGSHLYVCKILNTYAKEEVLDNHGKIDVGGAFKPVLFEPRWNYVGIKGITAKCTAPGKEYRKQLKADE